MMKTQSDFSRQLWRKYLLTSGRLLLLFSILTLLYFPTNAQNPPRTLLQGFWWDYWNNNYPNGYYNYLAELAPRLKQYGIDAIWIPPSSKGGGGTNDVGYGIFDHYDLGDKYQKGNVRTRLGTKDEYLRMVAVMHANGIDVIQDVVLNHVNGAGPLNAELDLVYGKGGKDPNAPDNQWKNFRYTSFSRPATDDTSDDYLNRNGRWPKNYQNFHKSGDNAWGHNDYNYPQHGEMFGPDICYSPDAINTNGTQLNPATYGLTSIFNPTQTMDYMKQQAIQWGVWLKKQSGVDGVRLDAVKHFEWDVTEAFLWNLQNGAGLYGSGSTWSNGGNGMFAVSEYIPEPGQASVNQFLAQTQYRTGVFDFDLRDAIYGMVMGGGFYNMSIIPGAQINDPNISVQDQIRGRTVNFINNHDTFRPTFDAVGNYNGWNTNNELRTHINPFEVRLPAAYAIACAMDGSPQIFFEDLFNIGGTGKRFTHLPTSDVDLPDRPKIANILWARKALDFASGSYKVRSAEAGAMYNPGSSNQDLLIIERSAKAVIGVNDNGSGNQGCWIDTDFPKGTTVKDYSGNTNYTYTIPVNGNDQRIYVEVPPPALDAVGNAVGGYVIIGPVGKDGTTFNPMQRETTQEWEMSQDLGDSHPLSLQQGGEVPLFGIVFETRTVGKVFSEAGKNIHVELTPTIQGKFATSIMLQLTDVNGAVVKSVTGKGLISLDYTATATGYYTIKIANQQVNSKTQNVFVKATYTAPQVINTSLDDLYNGNALVGESNNEVAGVSISVYPNPSVEDVKILYTLEKPSKVYLAVFDADGNTSQVLEEGYLEAGRYEKILRYSELRGGTYYYKLETSEGSTSGRFEVRK